MMNIEETRNKLRQFGVRVRLKGNHADKERVLQRKCKKIGIEPVYDIQFTLTGRMKTDPEPQQLPK